VLLLIVMVLRLVRLILLPPMAVVYVGRVLYDVKIKCIGLRN
jgi:hypothetical protein